MLAAGVPERQTAKTDDYRGPKAEIAYDAAGGLTKAGLGFARSRGARPEDVRREVVDGTEFAVVRVEAERRDAADVLPGLIPALVTGLQIPRGMRWGGRPAGEAEYLRFSRPIRWLVCKLGAKTVEATFYGLTSGDVTQGHRVLGAPVVIDRAEHYEKHLAEQKVVVSQQERRRLIVEGLDARAAELGGEWSDPGDVLAEAVYLAEWPSVARGAFAAGHLRLPAPVLITAMQSHQRYFPVRDADGRLLPAFLYVSNADPGAADLVTRGNERVLEGRLDDAEFAYDRDVAEGLDTMADRLGDVVFHEKLGSLADKARRLQGLVAGLAAGPGAAGARTGGNGSSAPLAETLRTAARLAKADLVSQVVIEFPVLQGVMGGIYAEVGRAGRRDRRRPWASTTARCRPRRRSRARWAAGCSPSPTRPTTSSARGSRARSRPARATRTACGARPWASCASRSSTACASRSPACWLRPSTSSSCRAPRGSTGRAARRHRRRDGGVRARAPAGVAARRGAAVPQRRGGAGRAGRRRAGAGGAGARLRRPRAGALSSRTP